MKKILILGLIIIIASTKLTSAQDIFLPPLNAKIIQYVNMNLGKQIGRGECWDLAEQALKFAGAQHPDTYIFGTKLNKNEEVFSGDIIQFTDVIVEYTNEKGTFIYDIPHHTAIIYEVLGKNDYKMADQNTTENGRKVAVSHINLNKMTKGSYVIYRPIENKR